MNVAGGPLRALASKDVTLFFREPAQWAQVLLVSVLTLTYVANLRSLPDLSRLAPWGHVASYLNLGVVLLLLSTLTTRFAFPLISMEGRRAWIVLLAPMPRRRIVWQKMLLAFSVAAAFGIAAAALSTRVLGVERDVRIATLVAAVAGAFALSGLAVGLGALIPNFKEDNPARIVTGFGGTLDFLLGLAHVVAVTVLLAAPSFLEAIGRWPAARCAMIEPWAQGGAIVLSLLVGLVPLVLGARHFDQLEL
jgi:ABC-2 type transport system permease protein